MYISGALTKQFPNPHRTFQFVSQYMLRSTYDLRLRIRTYFRAPIQAPDPGGERDPRSGPVPANVDQLRPDGRVPDVGGITAPESQLVAEGSGGGRAASSHRRREREDDRGKIWSV